MSHVSDGVDENWINEGILNVSLTASTFVSLILVHPVPTWQALIHEDVSDDNSQLDDLIASLWGRPCSRLLQCESVRWHLVLARPFGMIRVDSHLQYLQSLNHQVQTTTQLRSHRTPQHTIVQISHRIDLKDHQLHSGEGCCTPHVTIALFVRWMLPRSIFIPSHPQSSSNLSLILLFFSFVVFDDITFVIHNSLPSPCQEKWFHLVMSHSLLWHYSSYSSFTLQS